MTAKMKIDENACKGCGLCVRACPKKLMALSPRLNSKGYHPAENINIDECVACASCARTCPDVCISIEKN